MMIFTFTCPKTNGHFSAEKFEIIDNQGVRTDKAGNKTLDAKVKLSDPCPLCGDRHVFHASELACPFNGKENPKENQ
jgi:hypothetical protein